LGVQIPFVQLVRIRDVREHTMDITPQEVITKDNVEITVDGIMWVRPVPEEEAIKRTFYNIDNWKRAVTRIAMTNLRQEFGSLTCRHQARHAQAKDRRTRTAGHAAAGYR
jgi:regulator of protease activity HflC (stomatin/prohibitin superfamily)